MKLALDRKAELAAYGSEFGQADIAEFGTADTDIAQAEGNIRVLGIEFGHLYLTHVRGNPSCGLPIPTTSTLFEVVTDGRIHSVPGARLKKWIENRRQEWTGPRGLLFSQRPMIGD